jgi:hypothetical protein
MMPTRQDRVHRIDEAAACLDRALEAVGQIPKNDHTVTIDGIDHGLRELAVRLRALRDEVAGAAGPDDPAETGAG